MKYIKGAISKFVKTFLQRIPVCLSTIPILSVTLYFSLFISLANLMGYKKS